MQLITGVLDRELPPPFLVPGWRGGFAAQLLGSGGIEFRRKQAVAKFEAWLAEFKAKKPKNRLCLLCSAFWRPVEGLMWGKHALCRLSVL